jgi:hypothetical protein
VLVVSLIWPLFSPYRPEPAEGPEEVRT